MAWQGKAVVGPDHGLPEVAAVDVSVVGGGAAGVAAAEAAARHGLSVLLIERYGFCGGNAVAGLSGTICGLYLSSERNINRPEQAVFGFAERFRARIEAAGLASVASLRGNVADRGIEGAEVRAMLNRDGARLEG